MWRICQGPAWGHGERGLSVGLSRECGHAESLGHTPGDRGNGAWEWHEGYSPQSIASSHVTRGCLYYGPKSYSWLMGDFPQRHIIHHYAIAEHDQMLHHITPALNYRIHGPQGPPLVQGSVPAKVSTSPSGNVAVSPRRHSGLP